jgi:hypothetical protein
LNVHCVVVDPAFVPQLEIQEHACRERGVVPEPRRPTGTSGNHSNSAAVDNAVAVVPNAAEWSGWLVFRRLAFGDVPHYANRSIRPCSATTLAVDREREILARLCRRFDPTKAIAYPVHLARASVDNAMVVVTLPRPVIPYLSRMTSKTEG